MPAAARVDIYILFTVRLPQVRDPVLCKDVTGCKLRGLKVLSFRYYEGEKTARNQSEAERYPSHS